MTAWAALGWALFNFVVIKIFFTGFLPF
jgi:hypothetical protein